MRWFLLCLCSLVAGSATAGGPAQAVALAHADAGKLLPTLGADLHGVRYFWVSTPPGKEREQFKVAFLLHLNLLSRYSEPVGLTPVAPDLWRLDMDELKWDRATLEAARFEDPVFHEQRTVEEDTVFRTYWPGGVDSRNGKFFKKATYQESVAAGKEFPLASPWLPAKQITELRAMLFTEVPVLHAEWYLAQSSRQRSLANQQSGLGYYDFLRLKNRQDYWDLLGFDEKVADRFGKEIRAVAEISGVSGAPRQLVRLGLAGGGPVWVALDTNDPRKRGVALRNLEKGSFAHQIEEWYGYLPNGLPATFLSNEKGERQDNAPADAAGFRDNSVLNEGNDGRIHVNLACLRCHAGKVLLPIDDHVRKVFRSPLALGIADKQRFLKLRSQYFSDLQGALTRDQSLYAEAFVRITGVEPQKAVEAYARAFHRYADHEVTLASAAAELGVTEVYWKEALAWKLMKGKKLDVGLAPFLADPPVGIHRATWSSTYPVAQELLAEYALSGEGKK